jgi:hypothetical protein
MSRIPDPKRAARLRYLLLSSATGVVELGAVLYAARSGWSLTEVAALGLGYQIAALFVRPLPLSARTYRLVACVGALFAVVAAFAQAALPFALLPAAVGLQGIREEQLVSVSVATLPKRATRIAGFVIAAFFDRWFLLAVSMLVLCLATAGRGTARRRPGRWRMPAGGRYAVLMVIHQSHYFVYAYTLLFALTGLYRPSAWQPAVVFAVGWVTYTAAPVLFGRLPTLPVLVAGHVLVACAMTVIAADAGSRAAVSAAWVVGGLGGGTVFCIKRLAAARPALARDLDDWENIGHVTGCAGAVLVVWLLPWECAFVAAACWATATAILAMLIGMASSERIQWEA